MTTSAMKAEIRELFVKLIDAKRTESRRGFFRKLRAMGVEYIRCVRSGTQVHLYGVDSDGDGRYHQFSGGTSDTAYDGDWMHFSDFQFAITADGGAIFPTVQAQLAAIPVPAVELVDEKTKDVLAKKTTDALMADTAKALGEIKDLDTKLAYQHALKVHLRGVIQGRINPIMGIEASAMTGVDDF